MAVWKSALIHEKQIQQNETENPPKKHEIGKQTLNGILITYLISVFLTTTTGCAKMSVKLAASPASASCSPSLPPCTLPASGS